jgi:hypothetical protein
MRIKFVVSLCVLLLIVGGQAWAGPITTLQSGNFDTWYTGTSLANNAAQVSAAVTLTNSGYREAWCFLDIPGASVAPVAGSVLSVWFRLLSADGTTFADGDASIAPPDIPSMTFPLRAVTTRQVVQAFVPRMPTSGFRIRTLNDATGATITTAWTIKCKTQTPQS